MNGCMVLFCRRVQCRDGRKDQRRGEFLFMSIPKNTWWHFRDVSTDFISCASRLAQRFTDASCHLLWLTTQGIKGLVASGGSGGLGQGAEAVGGVVAAIWWAIQAMHRQVWQAWAHIVLWFLWLSWVPPGRYAAAVVARLVQGISSKNMEDNGQYPVNSVSAEYTAVNICFLYVGRYL